jgi:myo-inositol-1(or 4)-monophosphatase
MADPLPRHPSTDPADLERLALAIAVEAADMVRAARSDGFGITTKSTTTDMVTDLDHASDALIRARIEQARPNDAILTEESGAAEGTTGVTWVVDPIDGTTNFVYGCPPFNVSIGVLRDGVGVAGAVVEIARNEQMSASIGNGARLNGVDCQIRPAATLDHVLLATGFGYAAERRRQQGDVIAKIIHRIRDVRRLGAAAYDLCSVAAGRIDAYYEFGLGPWDLAAGAVIASEAGASVEALQGGPAHHEDAILAAHPGVIGPLRELLLECGAADIR